MHGFFKFVLYFGVVAGLLGFFLPQFADHPTVAGLPAETSRWLSFGGLGLVVLGLIGSTATRKEQVEWK
jgi:hypothetical protein